MKLLFHKRPPVLPLYLRGLLTRHRGLKKSEKILDITSEWQGCRIDKSHINKYCKMFGLAPSNNLPLLYPHTLLFPLHMSILGHPTFPLLYISMLQIGNHTLQRRQINMDENLNITCKIDRQQVTPNGFEFDINSTLSSNNEIVWENINTYYFRGKYGIPEKVILNFNFLPMSDDYSEVLWEAPTGGGFRFARLSGDFNASHYISAFARLNGFERDFAHGLLSVTHGIQHLPDVDRNKPIRVDIALKGPIYYSSPIVTRYFDHKNGDRFDIFCGNNPRPSICGNIQNIEADLVMRAGKTF